MSRASSRDSHPGLYDLTPRGFQKVSCGSMLITNDLSCYALTIQRGVGVWSVRLDCHASSQVSESKA